MNFIKKLIIKRRIKNYLYNSLSTKHKAALGPYVMLGGHLDPKREDKYFPKIKIMIGCFSVSNMTNQSWIDRFHEHVEPENSGHI